MIQTIILLEDHTETRKWFTELLQEAYPGSQIHEADSVQAARELISKNRYDLGIIDINLPDGSGIDVIREITRSDPNTYIVVATIFEDKQHIFEALKAGAKGYLNKSHSKQQFLKRLEGILNDEPPLSPAIARCIMEEFRDQIKKISETENNSQSDSKLTLRENEVLTLIAKGMSRKEIARALDISTHTVAEHVKNIYRKLSINTTAEATIEAFKLGLVKIDDNK